MDIRLFGTVITDEVNGSAIAPSKLLHGPEYQAFEKGGNFVLIIRAKKHFQIVFVVWVFGSASINANSGVTQFDAPNYVSRMQVDVTAISSQVPSFAVYADPVR